MQNTSLISTMPPQLPPLGFAWVSYLHVWLLLAAVGLLAGLVAAASLLQLNVTIEARGALLPGARTFIRSPEIGVVAQVLVAEGDSVAAGTVVVRLRSQALQRQLDLIGVDLIAHDRKVRMLRAEIAAARQRRASLLLERRQQVELTANEVERVRTIHALHSSGRLPGWRRRPLEDLIPVQRATQIWQRARAMSLAAIAEAQQPDARWARLQWLEATRGRLVAQQAHLRQRIAAHSLRAPGSGIVRTRDVYRLEGTAVGAGQRLLEIATSADWEARLHIPAREWTQVEVQQQVQLFVDAYPHARYGAIPARVRSISAQPEDAPLRGYPVRLHIAAADLGEVVLADGMTVTAHIVVDRGSVVDLVGAWVRRQFKYARPLQARLVALGEEA